MSRYSRPLNESRCCQPDRASYTWVDHVDAQHPSVVRFDDHLERMLPMLRAIVEGEINALFACAARGEIESGEEHGEPLKPIAADPEIWELRMNSPTAYRFYHGEPSRYPALLVKLHRHIKVSAQSQQREIEHAQERYYA